VCQRFPEDDLGLVLSGRAFATLAVGIFRAGRLAANIGKKRQADEDHQEQDEQPDILVSSHD
jgi:hypothetical protein